MCGTKGEISGINGFSMQSISIKGIQSWDTLESKGFGELLKWVLVRVAKVKALTGFWSAANKNIARLSLEVLLGKEGSFYEIRVPPIALVKTKRLEFIPSIFFRKGH